MTTPTDGEVLLPCPLCAKKADLSDEDTLHPSGISWYEDPQDGIRCYVGTRSRPDATNLCWSMCCPTPAGGCGMRVTGDSREEAIAKWNTRPTPQAGEAAAKEPWVQCSEFNDLMLSYRNAPAGTTWEGLHYSNLESYINRFAKEYAREYAAPQGVRDAIVEECAKVCEQDSIVDWTGGEDGNAPNTATRCARAIRALKSPAMSEGGGE